jgi:hypothetical protein
MAHPPAVAWRLAAAHTARVACSSRSQRFLSALPQPCVEDALAVCAAFNTTDRLADAFGFELLSPAGFESGAKYLLKRGYR